MSTKEIIEKLSGSIYGIADVSAADLLNADDRVLFLIQRLTTIRQEIGLLCEEVRK